MVPFFSLIVFRFFGTKTAVSAKLQLTVRNLVISTWSSFDALQTKMIKKWGLINFVCLFHDIFSSNWDVSSNKPSARRAIQALPQQWDPKSANKYVFVFFPAFGYFFPTSFTHRSLSYTNSLLMAVVAAGFVLRSLWGSQGPRGCLRKFLGPEALGTVLFIILSVMWIQYCV